MKQPKRQSEPRTAIHAAADVPPGTPAWITADLIQHTIRIWQPFYEHRLISEQAVEIIMSAGRMVDLLSSGDDHEAVRRTGESQQS